jgi:hypothetical protein
MSAERKAIRHKIVEKLLAANIPNVGDRVFASRTKGFFREELPAVCVYFRDETSDEFNTAPRELKRTAHFIVEILAEANDELDDKMDDIGDFVERTLHRETDLDGTVEEIVISQAQMNLVGDGEQPVGSLQLTFDAEYFTQAPNDADGEDEAEATPFKKVKTNWRPNAADEEAPQPGEEIELEQPPEE